MFKSAEMESQSILVTCFAGGEINEKVGNAISEVLLKMKNALS